MTSKEIGEYLYRVYTKHASSFHANIYKAGMTHDSKDIHRARLDAKKLFAIFGLVELLSKMPFHKDTGIACFRHLYEKSGKLRELQVSLALLNDSSLNLPMNSFFRIWLKNKEKKAILSFSRAAKKHRRHQIEKTDKIMYRICLESLKLNVPSKTEKFIKKKAEKINEMKSGQTSVKEIHRIRQHLRTISTISNLVRSVKPSHWLDTIVSSLNRTEMLIGDWHDRIILLKFVHQYMKDSMPLETEHEKEMLNLVAVLDDQCKNLEEHFMPEVDIVLKQILS